MQGRILITGGAGFVGANLAVGLARRHPDAEVVALDNLGRRGSELNLPRLREAGVRFVHGDVRELGDLLALDPIDHLVECSAEPSVMGGVTSGPDYLVRTNLLGAYHCLELARRDGAQVVFLSTSRVYPVRHLLDIRLQETETRFEIAEGEQPAGVGPEGISEALSLQGARTLYGASKLAAELLVTEYAAAWDLSTVVNRCGVIAGPWQMGKVDQGVFTHWLLAHYQRRPLTYIGYGGTGKQVRDLLHVEDVVDLIEKQLADPDGWAGVVANAGGGRETSLSLRETTALCEELTGRSGLVEPSDESRPGDVPIYVSDMSHLAGFTDWRPGRPARQVLEDTFEWIVRHEDAVRAAL